MKVLHITNSFFPCKGGVETVVLDSCIHSKANNIEAEVLTLNRCPYKDKLLQEDDEVQKIPIHRVSFFNLLFYKPAFFSMEKLTKHDILHVHGIGAFLDFVALTKPFHRKPIVVTTHGGIFHTKTIGLIKKFYFYFWARLILNFVDKIIAVSKQDYELFSKIAPKTKIELIENAIHLQKFELISQQKEENRFLFVGRLSKNKQIHVLIDIFDFIVKKFPNSLLFIVGDDFDNLEQSLKSQVKNLKLSNNVFIETKVDDEKLLEHYSKADFFISASSYEGFGLTAIEAMASGSIPILNNITAFNEFVEDFENGFLIDFSKKEHAINELTAVMNLKKQEKEQIRKNSITSIRKYSWEHKIPKLVRLYEGMLQRD